MTDLTTNYLGFNLRSPLVASAGPHTGNPAMWDRIEQSGAGAIVLPSLFEEEIENEAFAVSFAMDSGADQFGEALSYLPSLDIPDVGPARHLALVEHTRTAAAPVADSKSPRYRCAAGTARCPCRTSG